MNNTHKLPFLENRNYLHSSTLFNYLQQLSSASTNICFKFILPIYSDCFTINDQTENAHSIFQFQKNNTIKTLAIHPSTPSETIKRELYNEQEIINNAVFQNNIITFNAKQENFFAYSVALIKELHNRIIPKKDFGRWIFSRADFTCLPTQGSIIITHLKTLPLLTCCSISQHNKEIGKIYFSWVEKI